MTITTEQLKEIFAKIINELDPSPSTEEKIAIAINPNTPPDTLDRLSYDTSDSVRWYVARNPNTSPEILDRLSYDKHGVVREAAKNNPNFQKPVTISMTVKEINILKKLIDATQDEDLKSLSSKL